LNSENIPCSSPVRSILSFISLYRVTSSVTSLALISGIDTIGGPMKKILTLSFALSLIVMTNAKASDPTGLILTATSSTIPFTIANHCLEESRTQERCISALAAASSFSTILILKEEIQQVEADGYAFLAGEEMTLALEEVINKARQESAELDQLSDIEITSILLQSIK